MPDSHTHGKDTAHDNASSSHGSWKSKLTHLFAPHSHDTADQVDDALTTSRLGLRALWISLAAMGVTALLQLAVVFLSGSVALLGDTLHNFSDALTAIPLAIAFVIGRRAANERYTYGYGRAEDLAGVFILLVIAISACVAGYTAIDRLLNPQSVTHLWAVAVAALIGFIGNEAVARYRIIIGTRIGSAALVADGIHARIDGFTSLAVLLGAAGVAIGWQWADPVVGLAITVMILFVLKGAAKSVYQRLMDAIDPSITTQATQIVTGVQGVTGCANLRLRWIGHDIHAECDVFVSPDITAEQAHTIAHNVETALRVIPRLTAATVHTGPGHD